MKANSFSYRVEILVVVSTRKMEDKNLEREYLNSREEYYRLKANTSMLREKKILGLIYYPRKISLK